MINILNELGASTSDDVRIAWNVLPMLDFLTCTWVKGERGEMIQVGGLTHNTGIVAPANCGKSELGLHIIAAAINRIPQSDGQIYETEGTMSTSRPNRVSRTMARDTSNEYFVIPTPEEARRAKANGDSIEDRVAFIDGERLLFDTWHDKMQDISRERNKLLSKPAKLLTLPFIYNRDLGNKIVPPHFALVDSGSEAQIGSSEKMAEDHGVDNKKDNTAAMRDGLIKTKIYKKIGSLSVVGGIYVVSTGSIDDKLDMGGMPGMMPEKQMSHMGSGKAIKGMGTSFKKRSSNLWTFGKSKVFTKGSSMADKTPKYPYDADDNFLMNTDLETVAALNLRGKGGPSGLAFPIIRSQSRGILPEVMELETLFNSSSKSATNDPAPNYGIHIPKQHHFALDLLPDVHFRKTNFRELCRENFALRRAVELTFGMKMSFYVNPCEAMLSYKCTPAELAADIIAAGYNWVELFETRSWFTVLESEHKFRPFLSIYDLLRMRKGEYHPFWMEPKK